LHLSLYTAEHFGGVYPERSRRASVLWYLPKPRIYKSCCDFYSASRANRGLARRGWNAVAALRLPLRVIMDSCRSSVSTTHWNILVRSNPGNGQIRLDSEQLKGK